jgi:hypothetical protein
MRLITNVRRALVQAEWPTYMDVKDESNDTVVLDSGIELDKKIKIWPIPQSFIAKIQRKEYWAIAVRENGGREMLKIHPIVEGRRLEIIDNDRHCTRIIRPSNYKRIKTDLDNLESLATSANQAGLKDEEIAMMKELHSTKKEARVMIRATNSGRNKRHAANERLNLDLKCENDWKHQSESFHELQESFTNYETGWQGELEEYVQQWGVRSRGYVEYEISSDWLSRFEDSLEEDFDEKFPSYSHMERSLLIARQALRKIYTRCVQYHRDLLELESTVEDAQELGDLPLEYVERYRKMSEDFQAVIGRSEKRIAIWLIAINILHRALGRGKLIVERPAWLAIRTKFPKELDGYQYTFLERASAVTK